MTIDGVHVGKHSSVVRQHTSRAQPILYLTGSVTVLHLCRHLAAHNTLLLVEAQQVLHRTLARAVQPLLASCVQPREMGVKARAEAQAVV